MTPVLTWHPFRIPLRTPFRGVVERTGALVHGPLGWGEYSPFPGYSDREEERCLASAVAAVREPWPAAVRDYVEVHVTVPALSPEEASRLVRSSGCSAAKVKVAEGDDYGRVEAVRDALGPAAVVTVDANGAWTVDEAVRAVGRLERLGVRLVEQPVRTLEEMARVRRKVGVPLAADELVTSPAAARQIAGAEAADVLVIKVQSLGGVSWSLRTVEACGLPAVVSSLIETSVGLSAGVALAAALDELPYPCGLGTATLLDGDVVADPLVPQGGRIRVRRPQVDPALLVRFAASGPEAPAGWPG